jgi:uncharacterized protein (TIGR03437 family)
VAVSGDKIYVAGSVDYVNKTGLPEVNPIQPGIGGVSNQTVVGRCPDPLMPFRFCWDGFVSVFEMPKMELIFSSFLGGRQDDKLQGLAANASGDLVVAGLSGGSQPIAPAWPLPGSKSQWNFITKIGMEGTAPLVRWDWLTDAADIRGTNLIPGLIVALFGKNITAHEGIVTADKTPLPTVMDGVSVEVGGRPAPLYAVANVNGVEQINFLVPWDVTGSVPGVSNIAHVAVNNNGRRSLPTFVEIVAAYPSLFRQADQSALAFHAADWSLVTPQNPAHRNEMIVLYAIGFGAVDPPVSGADAAPAEPLSFVVDQPQVYFGTAQGEVLFCGLAPGTVGVYQANVRVPTDSPVGQVSIQFRRDVNFGYSSLPVPIDVE